MNKASSLAVPLRLAITYRSVGDLIPDPRNARTHPKRQIDQLKASIEAFGFTNPILADPEGHIIAGHGRLQAARAMGLTEVPTIILSGLSETQKRALRIADNKIALNAGWDLEILQLELSELASLDVEIDPTLTGFSSGEIDVILTSVADPDGGGHPSRSCNTTNEAGRCLDSRRSPGRMWGRSRCRISAAGHRPRGACRCGFSRSAL
ncbi:MAG: ParB/Srx family N-terminal domain-containing protein [Bradyrhizobium sp.]